LPACCSPLRRASPEPSMDRGQARYSETVDECVELMPYEPHTRAMGYASEGSACLREVPPWRDEGRPYEKSGGATPACSNARLPAGQTLWRARPEANMVQGRHGFQPGAPQTNSGGFLRGAESNNALFPLSISRFRVSILAIRQKVVYNILHCIEPIPSLPTHFSVI
jgi:hypothetical protein